MISNFQGAGYMVSSLGYMVHGCESMGYMVSGVPGYMVSGVPGYRVRGYIVSHYH